MRIGRKIRWAVVILLAMIVLGGAALFGLASYRPGDYQPMNLSAEQQDEVVGRLVDHVVRDFGNHAGEGVPFTWTITAKQANAYLASMDAIAGLHGAHAPPMAALERAGFSGLAVAMHDGALTLMVQSDKYDKILSLDLSAEFNDRNELYVRLRGIRVGALPIPMWLVDDRIEQIRVRFRDQLAGPLEAGTTDIRAISVRGMGKVIRALLITLEGKPIRPELVWPVGAKHRVLVDQIHTADGQAALHMIPSPPSAPPPRPSRP